jgi:5'-3' exonuclease
MTDLVIFDLSAVVYHAQGDQYHNTKTCLGLPVYGICDLLKRCCAELGLSNDIMIVGDSKTFRKEEDENYKKGRTPNRSVNVQLDLIDELLPRCGFFINKVKGFEADDLIHWACDELYDKYNNITIYSNDMDIIHDVRERVKYVSLRNNGPIVTTDNFERVADSLVKIPFNTISAHKTFCGCKSDNIKPVDDPNCKSWVLYDTFIQFCKVNDFIGKWEVTTSKDCIQFFINKVQGIEDSTREKLLKNVELVYPADKPDGAELYTNSFSKFNKSSKLLLSELLTVLYEYNALNSINLNKTEVSQELKDLFFRYKNLYETGAYSVDKNLEVDPSYEIETEPYFIKEF